MLRTHFDEHGYVRLDRAFAEHAPAMAAALWAELARTHRIDRTRRDTWTVTEPRGLGALRRAGAFDALATPAVLAALDELAGPDRPESYSWGDPLVTFPEPGEWAVPAGGWHIDFPARSALRLKWLGYLEPVGPGGGGTVVLAGSHRLVGNALRDRDPADPGRSPAIRDAIFDSHPWMRDLRRPGTPDRDIRLARGATVDGVDVRVVELTGAAGDVVFLHPHLFHAPAPNRSAAPRLMVTGGLAG